MKKIVVKGMSCGHCAKAVTKALESAGGITDVKVDLASGVVTYEDAQGVDAAVIKDTITKAGYEVV